MTNKTVSMTIAEIEKSSQEFKRAHKIKVSGPYDDEDMPEWFKEYAERTDARLDRLENEPPKWFKEFAQKQEKFNQFVLEQFEKHGWIKK